MSRRFELLVFDWDGTLMDSTSIIVQSLQAACRELGMPVPDQERAQYIIGLSLHDSLAYLLPGIDPAEYPRIAECYGSHFRRLSPDTPLFPETEDALRGLRSRGYMLGVATGKSRRGLDRELARTGLADVFHATRCGEESGSKPHPGMLHELTGSLGVPAAGTLMIGDTTHDMQMALNAGVAAIGVTYGAHTLEQLMALNPLACVNQPQELWQWIRQHA